MTNKLDPDKDVEPRWFCNGGDAEEGFIGGCKSGQTNFDYHEGTEGWQCTNFDECDFDLCEMCLRWYVHCE